MAYLNGAWEIDALSVTLYVNKRWTDGSFSGGSS